MAFNPNEDQKRCIIDIHDFIITKKPYSKLLINGSAGTGKTTILISSIIDYINIEIMSNYDTIKNAVSNNEIDKINSLNKFIIAAPTNKAKDVLVNKYNTYLNSLKDDTITDRLILNSIVNHNIVFLTVSQLLSISRIINEMGEEQFTKGNDKKITEKYNNSSFDNTVIIIDECSMIDSNTVKLLYLIRCPIIYIGDYCQLPPVNELLSPIFELSTDMNTKTIELKKVERCTNDITLIANKLRDKIYGILPDFNLLSNKIKDIIHYKKKENDWINIYIADIQTKLKNINNFNNSKSIVEAPAKIVIESTITPPSTVVSMKPIEPENAPEIIMHDSMALAWTNKCCSGLNKKIRTKIYSNYLETLTDDELDMIPEDFDIDNCFIINGDKLLVKSPYYKYGFNIYSSNIVYVSNHTKIKSKPLTFKEWCLLGQPPEISSKTTINSKSTTNNSTTIKPKPKTPNKTLNMFFDNITSIESEQTKETENNSQDTQPIPNVINPVDDINKYRIMFYKYHNYYDVIAEDLYNFTDELSLKFNNSIPQVSSLIQNTITKLPENFDLLKIKEIINPIERAALYKIWHRLMCIYIFGIPNDRIHCRKCEFFIKKFQVLMNKSCYIADMISATEYLELEMYLTDLVIFTTSGKYIEAGIPILDMNDKMSIDSINKIKEIMKNSYEIKIPLTKQDEYELRAINKMIGEDDNLGNKHESKYITMSQMFGHYLSHVITSSYLEVDYGYVLTVHKSQGSTYNDVYIEYNNLLANKKTEEKDKLLYTAITRSSNKLHVFY